MTGSQSPPAHDPGANEVQRLYTRRTRSYGAYIQAFGHRQGLSALLPQAGEPGAGQRVLDAGCGTGLSILALAVASRRRGIRPGRVDAFDLTPTMLRQRETTLARQVGRLHAAGIGDVALRQADVLRLDGQLPAAWRGYDLIICASVLEYVPRHQLPAALAALRTGLAPGGRLLIVITRSLFHPTRWIWHCQGYRRHELRTALAEAGLTSITARRYPWTCAWPNLGNHVLTCTAPGE